MSFDLYFQPLVHDKPLDYWKIRYDPLNTCHIGVTAVTSTSDLLSSFHVERPCGDPRLWEALFRVLDCGPIVLYFPGGPPIVASEEFAAALPKDVSGSLGEPRCVHSAAEICNIIREY